jgi:hypothetical protein
MICSHARALREVSITLKLHPGTPGHQRHYSTTPDSWDVAERHKDNMCSDVAGPYTNLTNLTMQLPPSAQ